MTAPILARKRRSVIRMYFEGLSLDWIAGHAGISKGSAVEIIHGLKAGKYEEYQDIQDMVDELRELAIFVRKDFDGDLQRCHTGAVAWVSLNRLGVDPAQVPQWAKMCADLTASDVPPAKFTEIALYTWRVKEEFSADLLDLPSLIDSSKESLASLQERIEALASRIRSTNSALRPLLKELELAQDIRKMRSTKRELELRIEELQNRRKAELAAAQLTSEGLEQFRLFADTAKAKGVPVDSELIDTLLALIGSLGPQGIQEVDTLRRLMSEQGMSPADGARLLTGLRRTGFTVSQAAHVARALGAREPFPKALTRLVSLVHHCGSLEAAAAALEQRTEGLQRRQDALSAESEMTARNLVRLRKENEDLALQRTEALAELGQVRDEIRRLTTVYGMYFQGKVGKLHRFAVPQIEAPSTRRTAEERVVTVSPSQAILRISDVPEPGWQMTGSGSTATTASATLAKPGVLINVVFSLVTWVEKDSDAAVGRMTDVIDRLSHSLQDGGLSGADASRYRADPLRHRAMMVARRYNVVFLVTATSDNRLSISSYDLGTWAGWQLTKVEALAH